MFRHTIDQTAFGKAYIDALAAAFLMGASMLPLFTISLVLLR